MGLGVELPAEIRTNDWFPPPTRGMDLIGDAERLASPGSAVDALLRPWLSDPFRGARERRVAPPGARSSDLEAAACRSALASCGRGVADIDLLLGYSQLSDDAGPGNHARVARALGAPATWSAMTVDSGCASFLPQLATATRLVQAGDARAALLYQSSLSSRIDDPASPTAPLLGDGAVAEVVGRVEPGLGLVGWLQHTRGELCDGLVLGRADGSADWTEASASPLRITSRDRAAAARMGADGPVFAREACCALLARHGLEASDIDAFVVAQASVWFGEACARAIGVPEGRWVPPEDHFRRYAHLLAASAPLNLWVAWTTGRLRKGDLVLVYTPGVGFTMAAALLRWALDPPSAR